MNRTAWTDERLDDLAARMDAGFARVDRDIRDLKGSMEERFNGIDQRLNSLETRISWFGGGLIIAVAASVVASALGG